MRGRRFCQNHLLTGPCTSSPLTRALVNRGRDVEGSNASEMQMVEQNQENPLYGRHRARAVICGNMLTAMNGEKEQTPVDKKDNYASGMDGTAIRCVLRKAAHEKWGIAAVDVKGAFLLAPRKETRRTLITRPAQILL